MTERREPPRILCAGGAVQDNVMKVKAFPAAGEKVQASDFVVTIGGQAGNASVAIARLGGSARYAGAIGGHDDMIANWIVEKLKAERVDCAHAVRERGDVVGLAHPARCERREDDRHAPRRGSDQRRARKRRKDG